MRNRKPLVNLVIGFILVVVTAIGIHAQMRNPSGSPTPTPSPTPTTSSTPRPIKRFPKDKNKMIVLAGVHVQISWRKEIGLPYNPARPRPPYPVCSMFRVRITTQEAGTPGTFGTTRTLADFNLTCKPTDNCSSYVCTDNTSRTTPLPLNRPMVITAELDSRVLRGAENGPWQAGSDATPPPGQHRAIIIIGGRTNNGITLTSDQPRQTVEFEIAYRPNPEPPR